jgi:prevent-host-death family protein
MVMKAKAVKTVPAGEFKTHCLKLMDQVQSTGVPLIITKRGEVVAHLVPPPKPSENAKIAPIRGAGKGYMKIAGDIISPASSEDDWDVFRE